MRRLVVVIAVLAAIPLAAQAAVDARLGGDFRMVGKITASSDGSQGAVRARTYQFRPLCPSGSCRKVALRREGPEGGHHRSILRRNRRGSYKGTERDRVRCDGGGSAFQTVRLAFKIVKAEDGEAVAIRGRAKFSADCPGEEFFQKARLYGTRR